MNLTRIKRPKSGCDQSPVIKLVTTTECRDNIGGNYYGVGDVIDGSEGVTPFPFVKVTNIRGNIKRVPRDIVRQISQNCRTQKVSSVKPYNIQGHSIYPEWKMDELEEMLHAKNIYIDGYEVVYRGGSMFEQIGTSCPAIYRLNVNIEECTKQQIYGCDNECTPNCYYFMIPARIATQDFFNEAGVKIAGSYEQLLSWYRTQSNVKEVTNIDEELNVLCEYFRAFKVIGTGFIPSFIFFDSPAQSNKVFGMALDCNQPNYSKLCGGVDNSACGTPIIGEVETFEAICGPVIIGTVETFEEGGYCNINAYAPWIQHTGDTSVAMAGNTRTLNISVFSSNYPSGGGGSTYTHTVSGGGDECHILTDIPYSEDISGLTVNGTPSISWSSYNDSGFHMIVIDPCIEIGDVVVVTYGDPEDEVSIQGDVIAVISGDNCTPKTYPIYITDADNVTMPDGATLVINTNGSVEWYGPPTSSDGSGSVIEVTGILYNV